MKREQVLKSSESLCFLDYFLNTLIFNRLWKHRGMGAPFNRFSRRCATRPPKNNAVRRPSSSAPHLPSRALPQLTTPANEQTTHAADSFLLHASFQKMCLRCWTKPSEANAQTSTLLSTKEVREAHSGAAWKSQLLSLKVVSQLRFSSCGSKLTKLNAKCKVLANRNL